MARQKNEAAYGAAKEKLLATGVDLIRSESFSGVGINDVLAESGVPRGSFYHYFESKEAFGLAVLQHYHEQQLDSARAILNDQTRTPLARLKSFFRTARKDFEARGCEDGCLMCNLSSELADTNDSFQKILKRCWRELTSEIAGCISEIDRADLGLAHLTDKEAADWLLNAWSGALSRMKAERSAAPLRLFEKTVFVQKKESNKCQT